MSTDDLKRVAVTLLVNHLSEIPDELDVDRACGELGVPTPSPIDYAEILSYARGHLSRLATDFEARAAR